MKKLPILLLLSALLAACGGAATLSNSNAKAATAPGAGQLNGGPNAGSDVSDINRTNPVVHKPGTSQLTPAPRAQLPAAAPGQPSLGSAPDRCSGGAIATGGGRSPSSSSGSGKRPLPMCPVE